MYRLCTYFYLHEKKVMSNSPRLVDLVSRLVDSLHLLDRRVISFEGRIKLMLNYYFFNIIIILDNILVREYFGVTK